MRVENVGESAERAFGRRVKDLRTARGWTQDDLARHLAAAGYTMHQTTVAKMESGVRPTDVGEIAAIAAIFGIQPAALFEDLPKEQQLRLRRLRWQGMRAGLIAIIEKRNRLRSELQTLETEYKSIETEYRRLGRQLGEEVNDIGEH